MGKEATNTPHESDLGYVTSKPNRLTDGYCVLYDGMEAGFDDISSGKWVLLCPEHGAVYHETNKQRALKLLAQPVEWCGGCDRVDHERRPKPTIVFKDKKTDAEREEERRFWAKKAQGDDEKCVLFERMYGVKPDVYW